MRAFGRWCALVLLAGLGLQLFFALRIASMAVLAPQSTSFERSQMWQIVTRQGQLPWRQKWADLPGISPKLQRAVIASEDSVFSQHGGVWWESLEKAWEKNAKPKRWPNNGLSAVPMPKPRP